MYDAYSAFDRRELDNERTADLNRENAAESDGITPANVPTWTRLRVERMDGSTDINATCNALCSHVRELEEAAADEIRAHMEELEVLGELREVQQAENERLRERVTNAETLLRAIREDWDRSSTGMIRLQLDILLGNPELRQAA